MLYSYKPLEEKLLALKMNKSSLGISSKTIAKIIKKEKIANHVLAKIANFLNYKVEDLYVLECENKILQRLLEENCSATHKEDKHFKNCRNYFSLSRHKIILSR